MRKQRSNVTIAVALNVVVVLVAFGVRQITYRGLIIPEVSVRPRFSLALQVLALQVLVVLVTVGVGAAIAVQQTRDSLTRQEGSRVLGIASSLAVLPQVRVAYASADPSAFLQPLAEAVRTANNLTFVVFADDQQVRLAHPDPLLIGGRLSTDAADALAGRPVVATERGTLGRTVRAKAPVRDDAGAVVGVVSVGSLEATVAERWRDTLPRLMLYLLGALAVGLLGSWLLSLRLRRQTYGLAPGDIGRLLEQREATLRGIREGLLVVDADGRVTLVNDEALRLLALPADTSGQLLDDLDLTPRLRDVVSGSTEGEDQIVLRAGRVLVLNREPIALRGRGIGAVVTLRDRTELDDLNRQLSGARSVTDALRAQAHEYANRMHTVAGLLELGEDAEALRFIERVTIGQVELVARLGAQVCEPALAALLLAKTASAAEHGVALEVTSDSGLPAGTGADPEALVTVVGNLVDNAVESLRTAGGGQVSIRLAPSHDGMRVEVRDSGPGVAPELVDEVFRHGFTTKIAREAGARGLGLALTRQACVTRGGWVDVRNDDGAVFTAFLPFDQVPVP